MEKFLQHGTVDRVHYRGSMDDCTDLLLGTEHHNDSYTTEAWRSSYSKEEWRGSSIVEARSIILVFYWVSSITMIHGIRDEKFLQQGRAENVQYHVSRDDCADPLLGIEHHNESYTRKRGEVLTPQKQKRLCLSVVEY